MTSMGFELGDRELTEDEQEAERGDECGCEVIGDCSICAPDESEAS